MPNFCCKHCGTITDNPEIVAHPDMDAYYRELKKNLDEGIPIGYWTLVGYEHKKLEYNCKYNHSITCPICLNETRFWREEPFPTDKEGNINLSSIPSRVI